MLPGFGLGLGHSLFWLCLIVLLPLAALVLKSALLGLDTFWATVTTERVLASLRLSFGASLLGRRHQCRVWPAGGLGGALSVSGKRLIDALVDLPFALLHGGGRCIALTTLYAPMAGLASCWPRWPEGGVHPAGRGGGADLIGLPFVVRTCSRCCKSWKPNWRSRRLPASRWQTLRRVIFPAVAGAADRFHPGLCPRHWRVWFGDFHAGYIPLVSKSPCC